MSYTWFSLITKTPLHVGQVKPNFNFLSTQDVIPGLVIRGAVAEYFLYRGESDKILEFINGTKFGFFRPSKSTLQMSLPLPLSALSCKAHSGFLSDKGKRHGVIDSLIPYLAYSELRKRLREKGAEFPIPFLLKCKECKSRMERITGFYIKEKDYNIMEIPKSSQTKVAINRKKKTAEEGMLYSITAIEPGVVFTGKILIDDAKISSLIEAIKKVGIGGLTTRGYGRVEVQRQEDPFISIGDVEKRLKGFNDKLKVLWKDLLSLNIGENKLPEEPEELYFSIMLISPAILKDEAGLPTLKLILNLNGTLYEPLIYFAQPEFIGGWSTAWGLPKETELGVKKGSVYVYKSSKGGYGELIQSLRKLELEGIGEKTEEGFGEILICNPFHKEVEPC